MARAVAKVLMHPRLFDNKFHAGVLRVPPQWIQFKDPDQMKLLRCSRIKPLKKKERQVVTNWITDAVEKGIIERSTSG